MDCIVPEKAMALYSSTLAWTIPWMEEPGGLQSMGSLRVGHDWVTSLSLFTFMHRRRKWQPTPVFLPGESQGWGSLVGCSQWGRTENSMDCIVHRVSKSQTRLSKFHFLFFSFYFAEKGSYNQRYGFSSSCVWMWELDKKESWAPKNWCFWTVVLEKTPDSPLSCLEMKPVHIKETSPGCSLEGLMLKLKLQYFGHLLQRTDSLKKTLMLGKTEGRRRRWRQKMRWLDGITVSMDMILSKNCEFPMRAAWCASVHGVSKW